MKFKKILACLTAVMVMMTAIGCGQSASSGSTPASADTAAAESTPAENESAAESDSAAESAAESAADNAAGADVMRIGSLKGPTSLGLVCLRHDAEAGESEGRYQFTMETQADVLAASFVKGDLDVILVPANLASVLYHKTQGGAAVVDINTLGVLYCVTGDDSITGITELAGREVITTGQGTTPEYSLRYLLDKYNITDCQLTFKSEAAEVAACLAEDPTAVAILPEPFVTVVEAQNDKLRTAFSLTEAWDAVSEDSMLVTGVTLVRRDYLETHEEAVKTFIREQAAGVENVLADTAAAAELVAAYGIIEKAPIAQKALPGCSLVCITGDEMKTALGGYLAVLEGFDASAIGGSLPGDDFYYGAA